MVARLSRWALVLVCAAGCGSSAEQPSAQRPTITQQSFAEAMQIVCDSPSEVSEQADVGARVTAASKWLSAHLTNIAARELWQSLAPLPPEEKAQRVQQVASRAGISRCPVAELWSAPEES